MEIPEPFRFQVRGEGTRMAGVGQVTRWDAFLQEGNELPRGLPRGSSFRGEDHEAEGRERPAMFHINPFLPWARFLLLVLTVSKHRASKPPEKHRQESKLRSSSQQLAPAGSSPRYGEKKG
jgi:hypothetical protein